MISFLLLTLAIICPSFSSSIKCKVRLLPEIFFLLPEVDFYHVNFPFRTDFAMSHIFLDCVFCLGYFLFLLFFFLIQNFFFSCLYHETCQMLVPWPGIEPMPAALKVWSFNPWTTKEVPIWFVLNLRCVLWLVLDMIYLGEYSIRVWEECIFCCWMKSY